ncbi:triphosphoribosyl-dephospho-CoA synthase [Mangrovibrevibacter kandeliae]|uniref:triphosphoribosyl-dephospho-CoA synthase n=1 Tax=Mangrovibrevibacter kandeliae TaxID=2968473 RepID=UPI002119B2CD|nr:triphosphoribosyl-dephospho-CoA synthase [Aurantimonas sp. CSK15Z-1]MCQ8783166.1 triphosphoribosyl-dephospho-CoA synthase [Aurantimonas sp. CSK15Z-1]
MSLSADRVACLYETACLAELDALKPGNVHRFAGGHAMTVETFETAAAVTAPHVADHRAEVGARILAAVEATRAAVATNANLGILLLCAPLAAAAERTTSGGGERQSETALRATLGTVLAALTPRDAATVFRAIALAAPGGLGEAAEHDVRGPPDISLVGAMRLAADRDLVARQYADGFAELFDVGLPAIRAARAASADSASATVAVFLAFASGFPDSHVGRKYGADAAEALRLRFAAAANRLPALADPAARHAFLSALDAELKREGLNPGTSADLTVATLFLDGLCRTLAERKSG